MKKSESCALFYLQREAMTRSNASSQGLDHPRATIRPSALHLHLHSFIALTSIPRSTHYTQSAKRLPTTSYRAAAAYEPQNRRHAQPQPQVERARGHRRHCLALPLAFIRSSQGCSTNKRRRLGRFPLQLTQVDEAHSDGSVADEGQARAGGGKRDGGSEVQARRHRLQ
jgi:hypothetical protein